jgi:hypothetical protein
MHEIQHVIFVFMPHVIFVFMPGVVVLLDFTNSLLSTLGIHASIQFIVVDGLTLVLSYECIIFNTWTLQLFKVVSEAFLVLGPFLVLSPCFVLHLTHMCSHLRYTGMNGVDLL